ncbi:ASCH domain-containing protein [Deinococcus sp. QL22]|uniref:ASCH domain-containing protein n=1 Tax=Deinococcus sp. QL22 TaxID=2939437 RepID=UPI002016E1A5|nr:ASCH domain-containing protein [Deinococcus sp. QL22]UQN07475.1 ASCH domain-containing protein [Deinococcus sp. QL22]
MTRIKEGLDLLLSDLEEVEQLELDAVTLNGYFGERPVTEKQMEAVVQRLGEAGYSIQTVHLVFKDVEGYRAFPTLPSPMPIEASARSLRALSIRQPHIERIFQGAKNIEYRSWQVKESGPLLLHASNTREAPEVFAEADIASPEELPYGSLVGIVDVVECLYNAENEDYEWLLAHPRRFRVPIPYKGAAGIFRVPVTTVEQALAQLV